MAERSRLGTEVRRRLRVARANTWAWIKAPQGVSAGVTCAALGAVAAWVIFREPGEALLVALGGLVTGYLVYLAVVFGWHLMHAGYRLRPKRLEFQAGEAQATPGYTALVGQNQLGIQLMLAGPNDFPDFRCSVRDKHGDTRSLYVPKFVPFGYDGGQGAPITHQTYPVEWAGAPLENGRFEFAWTVAGGGDHKRVAWGWFKAAVRPFPEGEEVL